MSRCVESLNPHRTWSQPKASLVYGIFLLETLQTALSGADIYYWFASGFGNMLHLGNPYISPFDTPVLCSLIALLVQGFFCYRIWLLIKSARWLSGVIGCVSVHQLDYVDISDFDYFADIHYSMRRWNCSGSWREFLKFWDYYLIVYHRERTGSYPQILHNSPSWQGVHICTWPYGDYFPSHSFP